MVVGGDRKAAFDFSSSQTPLILLVFLTMESVSALTQLKNVLPLIETLFYLSHPILDLLLPVDGTGTGAVMTIPLMVCVATSRT
jgi:hypothetical protein